MGSLRQTPDPIWLCPCTKRKLGHRQTQRKMQEEDSITESRRETSVETNRAAPWFLPSGDLENSGDFWPPELWEHMYLCTTRLWYFIMAALADWYTGVRSSLEGPRKAWARAQSHELAWSVQENRASGWPVVRNPPASAGDAGDSGSIPGSGRFPWRRNGNPHQYSGRDNPMDRRAWRATVHGVAKSQMWPSTQVQGKTSQHVSRQSVSEE